MRTKQSEYRPSRQKLHICQLASRIENILVHVLDLIGRHTMKGRCPWGHNRNSPDQADFEENICCDE